MRWMSAAIAAAAICCPSLVLAQTSPAVASPTDERRLTPEQIEAVLAEAAKKRAAAEKQVHVEQVAIDEADPSPPPQVHGEVGFGIGTGGYREVFGTGVYPIGEDGVAAISLDFVDWGNRRFPPY